MGITTKPVHAVQCGTKARSRAGSTQCVHGGTDLCEAANPVTVPIVHSAPFAFECTRELIDMIEGRSARTQPEYGRMGNPTIACVEKRLAAVEGAEKAQLFGSGMAAFTTLLLTYLKSGDHVVITSDSYKRSRDFAVTFLSKFGIKASVVPTVFESIEQAIQPVTRMVFTEAPTNPFLYLVDVERLAELGQARNVLTVVDSTFATPVNLRPLDFGVDLVLHSATKYLGGHNDLIAGVLAGSADRVGPVSELLMTLGAISDPNTAFLLDRGLKTLALRIAKQNANGQAVAEFLEDHSKVKHVFYLGLTSHPHHSIAKGSMTGYGGVVTFLVDSDFDGTARFIDSLRIPKLAPSLGGVESLVEQVVVMSYWKMPRPERERLGMTENLVRLSLGIEDAEDLIADLAQALDNI